MTEAGTKFGPYRLTERIGRGGMAVVYKAKIEGPSGFEKQVVVKTLLPSLVNNPEFLELFTAEAKTTARLSHPGIVHLYDFGILDGTPYLVMEHLAGINLFQLVNALKGRGTRLPAEIAIVMITQVCHALGYAHQFRDADGNRQQIIHGDVSPSNIIACREGTVKLLDFGVARVMGELDFDVSDTLKGKFAYMAPERVNRLPYDRRVDVFAAGIVLHELLTMQRLFAGATDLETLQRVDAARVEPPSRINPEITPEVDAVVLKALARDPDDRFDSGEEMAEALEEVTRIAGGRRRVADFLASVFPQDWYLICRGCGRRVVPGLVCRSCGSEAPRESSAAATYVRAPRAPMAGRPPSLTRIVLPTIEPPPPPRRRAALIVGTLTLALLALGGAGLALLLRPPIVHAIVNEAPPAPLALETLPQVEVAVAVAPAVVEEPPAQAPKVHRSKKRPRPKRAHSVAPSRPVERIKQGRLLDPFNSEAE